MSRERQNVPLALSGPVRFVKGVGNSYFAFRWAWRPCCRPRVRRCRPRLSARPCSAALGDTGRRSAPARQRPLALQRELSIATRGDGAAVLTGRPALFPARCGGRSSCWPWRPGPCWRPWPPRSSPGRPLSSAGPSSELTPGCYWSFSHCLTAILLCLFEGFTRGTVFDRYLWPLDLSLAVLLLAQPGARHRLRPSTPFRGLRAPLGARRGCRGTPGRTQSASPLPVTGRHGGIVSRGGGGGRRYNTERRRLRRRPLVSRQQSRSRRGAGDHGRRRLRMGRQPSEPASRSRDARCPGARFTTPGTTRCSRPSPSAPSSPATTSRSLAAAPGHGHVPRSSASQGARSSTSTWSANPAASRPGRAVVPVRATSRTGVGGPTVSPPVLGTAIEGVPP